MSQISLHETVFDQLIRLSKANHAPLGSIVQAGLYALNRIPDEDRRRLIEYCNSDPLIGDVNVDDLLNDLEIIE